MIPSVRSPLLATSSSPSDGEEGEEKAATSRAAKMSAVKERNLVMIIPFCSSASISRDPVSHLRGGGAVFRTTTRTEQRDCNPHSHRAGLLTFEYQGLLGV